jgi:hypothetical protein
MYKQIHKLLFNIILVVGGVAVAITLLELGTRVFTADNAASHGAFICSDQLGWRGNPDYTATLEIDGYEHLVSHNSIGMHDGEHQLLKSENEFRILMLGDSFTRAAHVNETETTHQILEELLNEKIVSKDFEIISAAMSGWGTGQELIYYRKEGRFYQPDMVLLMFYIGNDVIDNLPGKALTIDGRNCYAPYFVICDGQLDTRPWHYAPGLEPVMKQCPFGRKILANTLGRIYLSSQLYTKLEPLFAINMQRIDQLPYYPLYIPEENELYDYGWELTIALIKQLHQEVINNGSEFAVVLISPVEVVSLSGVSPDVVAATYPSIPEVRKMEPDLPYTELSEKLSQEGINVLNLQPSFIQHFEQTGENLYFPQDKHWNVKGNRFAAKTILEWLTTQDNIFHLE